MVGACQFDGFITAKSVTDIYYLTHRITYNDSETREILSKLFSIIGSWDTTVDDIFHALSSEMSDYEDAVMVENAIRNRADYITTMNTKDYRKAKIPVYTPADFSRMIKNYYPYFFTVFFQNTY